MLFHTEILNSSLKNFRFWVDFVQLGPKTDFRSRNDGTIVHQNRSGPRGLATKYCLLGLGQRQEAMYGLPGGEAHT